MRFVSAVNSLVGKARRAVSQAASVSVEDVKDPAKLAEALRTVTARVNRLEAALVPEATEFEVNCGDTGDLVELKHGLKGPVRWTVVGWFCVPGGMSPVKAANLVYDPSSTSTSLFLRSYVQGRAVIRVEPSQQYIDPGPTLDLTDTQTYPRIPFGPVRKRITVTGTAVTPLLNIQIPDNAVTIFRTAVIGRNKTTLTTTLREVCLNSCYRVSAGVPTNFTATVQHSVVVAGMTYTFTVSGNDILISVQCTTAAQTVDWSVIVEPVHVYLTSEP